MLNAQGSTNKNAPRASRKRGTPTPVVPINLRCGRNPELSGREASSCRDMPHHVAVIRQVDSLQANGLPCQGSYASGSALIEFKGDVWLVGTFTQGIPEPAERESPQQEGALRKSSRLAFSMLEIGQRALEYRIQHETK